MNEKINEIVNQILVSDSPGLLDFEFSIPTNGEIKLIIPGRKMKLQYKCISLLPSIELPRDDTYFYCLDVIDCLVITHTLKRKIEIIEL